ncbi:uncharacterized protein LOC123426231 [Hordeum vulgare subsp. vulgare]|uniref:Predicted protein n=1 Tax=Hordeum vulgare subsp. vulgare TaxID=112509 RepID=F2EI56_HORVV|nr:uncharacterized protein LOC123426231 [Hordeum vulgare subsp. vulgare]BAK07028.1 predicted protein [Hordeum vulgare subsp. vulgare]
MAHALAQALRSLLARCSTKCPRAAVAAASSSCLRSAVRHASYTACPRSILPTSCGGAVSAAQTRFVSSIAGLGPGDEGSGEEEECVAEWEEDEDEGADAEIGDGGDGGGVVLRDVKWGARALLAAEEILGEHFGDDIAMFAFKVSPKGYVYVRLDKLTSRYGCPGIEEIENFNRLYKQKLDEIIERGEIPLDLALEISSPGAERLLKVPGDLDRFKDMAMRVQYLAEGDGLVSDQVDGIFMLESVDIQTEHCVWKLADVNENRAGKGRPLNRKQRDWRLQTSFDAVRKATLYLD